MGGMMPPAPVPREQTALGGLQRIFISLGYLFQLTGIHPNSIDQLSHITSRFGDSLARALAYVLPPTDLDAEPPAAMASDRRTAIFSRWLMALCVYFALHHTAKLFLGIVGSPRGMTKSAMLWVQAIVRAALGRRVRGAAASAAGSGGRGVARPQTRPLVPESFADAFAGHR
uniref:Uncharacterized protein n=1 Tax=Rhizochromulina marina TaxID=1034831 RepID=A0A7S2SD03_9STRA